MAASLYEMLGVTPDASPAEIKRAYYNLIRKHPPEKEPERYRLINEAWSVLSNEESRRSYDETSLYGDEVEALMDAARRAEEEENWATAVQKLKMALALTPTADYILNRLALVYAYDNRFPEAVKSLEKLTTRVPTVPVYWSNLGEIFLRQADWQSENGQEKEKTPSLEKGRAAFETAYRLEPYNQKHLLGVSRCYKAEKNYPQAIAYARRAITADGEVDYSDFDTLFEIAFLHVLTDDWDGLQKVVGEINSVTPSDPEIRSYVASRFARLASELFGAGGYSDAARIGIHALTFQDASARAELEKMVTFYRYVAGANEEMGAFSGDQRLPVPLRYFAYLSYMKAVDEPLEDHDDEFQEAWTNFLRGDGDHRLALLILRMEYPHLYWLQDNVYDKLAEQLKLDPRQGPDPMGDGFRPLNMAEDSAPQRTITKPPVAKPPVARPVTGPTLRESRATLPNNLTRPPNQGLALPFAGGVLGFFMGAVFATPLGGAGVVITGIIGAWIGVSLGKWLRRIVGG